MTKEQRRQKERLFQAEQFIDALRSEEVDAVVGKEHVLLLRLQELEEALRRSEARYRGIVETQTELICCRKPDSTISFVNNAYCRFFGKTPEELVGKNFDPPVYEKDAPSVERAMKELDRANPVMKIECRMKTGEDNLCWCRWIVQALYDKKGALGEIQAIGRDVSEQKTAEKALRAAHLELTARNQDLKAAYKELYEYSEAVSHDLNGVIRAVSNYTDFLYEDLSGKLPGEQRIFLENLKRVSRAGGALIRELRELAKIGKYSEAPQPIDFDEIVNEAASSLGLNTDKAELIFADVWPELQVEPNLIRLILANLLSNAAKFNPSNPLRIEVGWREHIPGRVEIFVSDNGIGIDPRHHERIFQVFKRLHTDKEYRGSGMGLAIVSKAARHLGGTVRVESEPGRGSTFFVDLPLSKISAAEILNDSEAD